VLEFAFPPPPPPGTTIPAKIEKPPFQEDGRVPPTLVPAVPPAPTVTVKVPLDNN
jgi:hypothetical protein